MKVFILLLTGVVTLTSCSAGVIAFKFYVVIKPDETGKFIEAVIALAKESDLETAVGQAAADTGNLLRVVEGRSSSVKLWVQNMPMSGEENSKLCGLHPDSYSDPAQFVVSTESRFFGSKTAATRLGERIYSRMQKRGFDVRREPAICGAAAIHDFR